MPTTKPTLLLESKDEWDNTKEVTGKSIACTTVWQKGTAWAEATLSSEKTKPVVLAIVELCESEGIRQLVS